MKRVLALAAALLLVCSPLCLADGFRHPAPEIEEFALASPVPTTLFSADLTRAVVATRECRQVPLAELAASEVRIAGLRIGARAGTALGWKASVLGGVILIAIGVEIFVSNIM